MNLHIGRTHRATLKHTVAKAGSKAFDLGLDLSNHVSQLVLWGFFSLQRRYLLAPYVLQVDPRLF